MGRPYFCQAVAVICLCACGSKHSSAPHELPHPSPEPAPPEVSAPEPAVTRPPYAEILWKTSIGKSYHELLFSGYPRDLFPGRSQRLALKIVSDTQRYPALVAALQIMNEDLYVTQRMTEEVRAKIQILESEIAKDLNQSQTSAFRTVLSHIPFVFLASLPWGSPLIRSEISKFVKGWTSYALARVRGRPWDRPEIQWRALFSRKVVENYEPGRPLSLFFQTVAPFSLIEYFLIQEGAGNLTGELTMEEMIRMADF